VSKPTPEQDVQDELEDELDSVLDEDEGVDEDVEDLDDEIEDEEEDEEESKPKVEKEKAKKAPKGFTCVSVEEKHPGDARPCYTATAPFRQSPARNGAFKMLQDAGKNGLDLEAWVGETATLFEDESISGSAKGAVSFIQKATRRVTITKLPDGNYVVVEPLADKSRRTFNKNGTVRKASK